MKQYLSYKDSGVEWLGKIPSHWHTAPIKRTALINSHVLPENTDPNFLFRYIEITQVMEQWIDNDITLIHFKDSPSRARRIIHDGDTIVSTVRTYLKAIAFIGSDLKDAIVSTGFAVLSPKKNWDPKFFSYVIRCHQTINLITSHSKGVSYPAITSQELGNIKIINSLPLTEQKAIVAYLDRRLTEIDEYIERKRRIIKLLQEQLTCIIEYAVTHGINPSIRLKNSGITWMDKVPEHWEIKPVKHFFREINEQSKTGSEELLSVSHLTGLTPRSEKNVTMFMAESYEGSKLCSPDDLVINIMWAWMGALGVSSYRGIVSGAYGVYRQKKKVYHRAYLDYLVRTHPYIAEYTCHSKGIQSSRLRMYTEDFFTIKMICPPLEEQITIINYIEQKSQKINASIAMSLREIALMKEYRTALLTFAVTGQIDVRNTAMDDTMKEGNENDAIHRYARGRA